MTGAYYYVEKKIYNYQKPLPLIRVCVKYLLTNTSMHLNVKYSTLIVLNCNMIHDKPMLKHIYTFNVIYDNMKYLERNEFDQKLFLLCKLITLTYKVIKSEFI